MKVKAKLELTVWYDDAKSEAEANDLLELLVQEASNRGMMSWGSGATVDTWDHKITTEKCHDE
jgi:hypothetical protein